MEVIELDLDDENEMTFKVQIEGTRPGVPLCRLMIEGSEMTHSIQGDFQPDNEVVIVIPPMKTILKEGNYDCYLEVLVDDRVFIPLEMKMNFENSVKVVAESVNKRKKSIKASATLVSSKTRRSKVNEEIKEEKDIKAETFHPAKRRYEEKKSREKISEKDIMSLVDKIRKKVR
tara:strand:- start:1848 stop:2369 length:522 start_codon:yes stop_codon:yes gene_type:complete